MDQHPGRGTGFISEAVDPAERDVDEGTAVTSCVGEPIVGAYDRC
jgi:hypothetical protein